MNSITFDENTEWFIILKNSEMFNAALDNEAPVIRWNERLRRYEQLVWEYTADDVTDGHRRVDEEWVEIK